MKTKLLKDWKDFKIVESCEGTFTGQVSMEPEIMDLYTDWNKPNSKARKLLAQHTKEFLEEKLGYKIEAI